MKHTEILTIRQLANYLRCDVEFLENAINKEFTIIDSKEQENNDLYLVAFNNEIKVNKLYIKKKGVSSGYRIVHAVNTFQLSNTLKILNNYLSDIFIPKKSVHGFVKDKSIKTNAREHLGKKNVLSVDIERFFESITKTMVSNAFFKIGFSKVASDWLSNLTTINGHLVQGFNTSPTIANIVADEMDIELAYLSGNDVTYTRYADDLYFSTNNILPSVDDIENIISNYGFKINQSKTKEMKRGNYQFVTGLTVFDDKMPRIPKRIKKNLRLEIYFIQKYGYKEHAYRRLRNRGVLVHDKEFHFELGQEVVDSQHRLFGWIHYIFSIEPKFAGNLYEKLINPKR